MKKFQRRILANGLETTGVMISWQKTWLPFALVQKNLLENKMKIFGLMVLAEKISRYVLLTCEVVGVYSYADM